MLISSNFASQTRWWIFALGPQMHQAAPNSCYRLCNTIFSWVCVLLCKISLSNFYKLLWQTYFITTIIIVIIINHRIQVIYAYGTMWYTLASSKGLDICIHSQECRWEYICGICVCDIVLSLIICVFQWLWDLNYSWFALCNFEWLWDLKYSWFAITLLSRFLNSKYPCFTLTLLYWLMRIIAYGMCRVPHHLPF